MAAAQPNTTHAPWPEGTLRAFISHTHHNKTLAGKLQQELQGYGVACFVAHENIEPLQDWDVELRRALDSMHVLIALITRHFHASNWTDQEIGIAIGKDVPVIPVHLGVDPYGFIGRIQALKQDPTGVNVGALASEIFRLALRHENTTTRSSAKSAYVLAVTQAWSFDRANHLASFLKDLDNLTPAQAKGLVDAFNENGQVYRSFQFNEHLIPELQRLTEFHYEMVESEGALPELKSLDLDVAFHFD